MRVCVNRPEQKGLSGTGAELQATASAHIIEQMVG